MNWRMRQHCFGRKLAGVGEHNEDMYIACKRQVQNVEEGLRACGSGAHVDGQ